MYTDVLYKVACLNIMAYEGMLILNILNICISFHKELNNIAALFYCISYENHMHRNIGLT